MSIVSNTDQLTRQLEDAQRRIELIRTVTLELNTISNLPTRLNNILKILHQQFGINHSMIVLPDKQQQKMVIKASFGYGNRQIDDTLDVSTGIIGLSARSKRPINITNLQNKKKYFHASSGNNSDRAPNSPGLNDPESQIAIPLVVNDELVAVLLAESYNISVFSKEDELFLITLSQSIALSIQNAMLFDNMEEIIAERTAALQKSNQTKDQLFSIISHDLRGPVTSFHNISKLIHHYNKQGEKDKIDTLFGRIDRSVSRLNHLLDNLLNWSLTHRNEIRCQIEKINLTQLLNEVIAVYEEQLLFKSLRLTIDSPEQVFVAGDFNMLSAVFRNVISNALKYTSREGSIAIKVEVQKQIIVNCTDTGVGISADRLAKLLEFNVCSTQGTENEKGTGLGLVIAKEFVQLHQGELSISSIPETGTTVTIKLPAFS